MAKMKEFDSYDLLSQRVKGKRIINIDQVVEISGLTSSDENPITRIKLSNGDFFDVPKGVDNIKNELNN